MVEHKTNAWYVVTSDGLASTYEDRTEAEAAYAQCIAQGFQREVTIVRVHQMAKATIGVVAQPIRRRQRRTIKAAVGA